MPDANIAWLADNARSQGTIAKKLVKLPVPPRLRSTTVDTDVVRREMEKDWMTQGGVLANDRRRGISLHAAFDDVCFRRR